MISFKRKIGLVILLAIFWAACHHPDKGADKAPQKETFQELISSQNFTVWQDQMTKTRPGFSLSHFKTDTTGSLPQTTVSRYGEEEWEHFSPYFIVSPNKSSAIDLGMVPDSADSSMEFLSGSAESQVNLVHISDRTGISLMFTGPGTLFEGAHWINDSLLYIYGETDANKENSMTPAIWKINLSKKEITDFRYADTTSQNTSD